MDSKDSKNISILVVENHDDTRERLAAYLSSEYTCFAVASAAEAMRLIAARPFNLVLTDIHLPDASGLEVCRLISRIRLDTIVMVMTGMSDISYRMKALNQGAWYCIQKPIDPDRLLVWVKAGLRCQMLARERRHYNPQARSA